MSEVIGPDVLTPKPQSRSDKILQSGMRVIKSGFKALKDFNDRDIAKKSVDSLGQQISKSQDELLQLEGTVRGLGAANPSETMRLRGLQMQLRKDIETKAVERQGHALQLETHYKGKLDKLKEPKSKRDKWEQASKDADKNFNEAVAAQEERREKFRIANDRLSAIMQSGEVVSDADMKAIEDELKGLDADMKIGESHLQSADNIRRQNVQKVSDWDRKHGKLLRKTEAWGTISKNGRVGTGAEIVGRPTGAARAVAGPEKVAPPRSATRSGEGAEARSAPSEGELVAAIAEILQAGEKVDVEAALQQIAENPEYGTYLSSERKKPLKYAELWNELATRNPGTFKKFTKAQLKTINEDFSTDMNLMDFGVWLDKHDFNPESIVLGATIMAKALRQNADARVERRRAA